MTERPVDIDKLIAALSPEQRVEAERLIVALRNVDDQLLAELLLPRIKSHDEAQRAGAAALSEAQRSFSNILALRDTHPELARSFAEKLVSRAKRFSDELSSEREVPHAPEAPPAGASRDVVRGEAKDSRLTSLIRNYWYLQRLNRTNAPLARSVLTAEVIARGLSPSGENAAATALNRLVEQGFLHRPDDGYFSIMPKGRIEIEKLKGQIEKRGGRVPDML